MEFIVPNVHHLLFPSVVLDFSQGYVTLVSTVTKKAMKGQLNLYYFCANDVR